MASFASTEPLRSDASAPPSPSEDPAIFTSLHDLSMDILGIILSHADAWLCNAQGPPAPGTLRTRRVQYGGWQVCRHWRACLRAFPMNLARAMVAVHGPDEALMRVMGCNSHEYDNLELVRLMLNLGARADCMSGRVLKMAVQHGHCAAVKLLLGWREHAPRADRQGGKALVIAAQNGHETVVHLLLEWREHAPHANCRNGEALVRAAENGHEAVAQLLLGWRKHAPRANCQNGEALVRAARNGHEAAVRLLLGWSKHAPHADCQDGEALVRAAGNGHEGVVRLLLGWKEHAPHAGCQDGKALVLAAGNGHEALMWLLLDCSENAPLTDLLGRAQYLARRDGCTTVMQMLQKQLAVVRLSDVMSKMWK